MEIEERAKRQRNGYERVLHRIPGFRGYYEREFRRDSDRLQREFIVEKLREVKTGFNDVVRAVTHQNQPGLLTAYDEFARLLERNINEIRYADRGYSGFFDLIKIREAELDAVYQVDADLVDAVIRVGEDLKRLAAQPTDASVLPVLQAGMKAIGDKFRERGELLEGYRSGDMS
jgi:hypothetical protein